MKLVRLFVGTHYGRLGDEINDWLRETGHKLLHTQLATSSSRGADGEVVRIVVLISYETAELPALIDAEAEARQDAADMKVDRDHWRARALAAEAKPRECGHPALDPDCPSCLATQNHGGEK